VASCVAVVFSLLFIAKLAPCDTSASPWFGDTPSIQSRTSSVTSITT
jgi:hypothetical protein